MEHNLTYLLPSTVVGWAIASEDHVYDRENLYDYIDGGAELFFSYGFQQLLSRTYATPGQPEIIVDVFDMGSSDNAYGVFSYSRETEDSTFGQGSQSVPGLLLFWKDRYYISILFTPETEKAREAAFFIARHIESAIQTSGALPEILQLLPDEALARETIRYFRHYIWLNSYLFISNENILHLNEQTAAVLAKYGVGEPRQLLLLILYPDESAASAAYNDFVQYYFPNLSESTIALKEDKWIGCQLQGTVLIAVFNAADKESAYGLIERVKQRSQ